jgi:hypothetical protein
MATFNKVQAFVEDQAEKVHNLGADALKVMLVNSPAPVNTNSIKANLTEIAAGNGYSAGGAAPTITSSAQTSGTYKLVLADVVFVAAGGSIGPFRYAMLYNSTPGTGPLIGWFDYGSSISLANGESFTVDFDATAGVLTVA